MGASDGGGIPVAHTAGQAVDIGAPITARVTVRDLSGMPLSGATVRAVVGGTPTGPAVTTDATGLATLNTTNRASLGVRAELDGFDYAIAAVDVTASEVFVTPRLRRPFALRHPYAWQNRVMRERLFREHAEDREDPGAVRPVSAEDRKDRVERLLDISEYLGGALGIAHPTASAAAVDAERARLQRTGEHLDDLSARSQAGGTHGLDDAGEEELASDRGEMGLRDTRPAPRRSGARTDRMERRDETAAAREARRLVDGRLARVNELALSHRELLDHLVNRVFPAAPEGAIGGWLKYMIIHFTGLRYVNSNASYHWPKKILAALRAREIDAGELDSADAERLRIYTGEARAIVATLGTSPPRSVTTAMGFVDRFDPAHAGEAAPRGRGGRRRGSDPTNLTDALEALHKALADAWSASISDNEIFGLLRLRSEESPLVASAGRLAPSEWAWTQTHTQMRNDLTTWDESAREPDFLPADMDAWKDRQGWDLVPAPWGAQCNQIAEMAAQARGIQIRSGISHCATCGAFAPRSPDGLSSDGGPLIGSLKTRATSVGTDTKTLWRPTSTAELSQGDIFFKMMWVPLHETRDRGSNWVFPTRDMVFNVGRAYTSSDPVPRVQATRTDTGRSGSTRTRISSTITSGEPTGAVQIIDPSTLREVDEDELAPAAPDAGEFQPAEGGGSGFQPIDRPLDAAPGDNRGLYARSGQRVVRRHPGAAAYHDVLIWYHIGTIVATDATRVYTYETAAPVGMRRWPFGGTGSNPGLLGSWEAGDPTYTVFARPTNQVDHPAVAGHINPSILFTPYLED